MENPNNKYEDRDIETVILKDLLGTIDKMEHKEEQKSQETPKESIQEDINVSLLDDLLGALDEKNAPAPVITPMAMDLLETIKEEEKIIPNLSFLDEIQITKFTDLPEIQIQPEMQLEAEIKVTHVPAPAVKQKLEVKIDPEIQIKADAKNNELMNQIEAAQKNVLTLKEENAKLKKEVLAKKQENEEIITKMSSIQAENEKMHKELSMSQDNAKIGLEARLNKANIIEEKYNALATLHEELKAKVRRDIRKIKIREKELANKLDITRQDSQTLINAKDQKIMQLKKHIDNFEYEAETMRDKIEQLQNSNKENAEKAERVIRALKLSTSLLESDKEK